MMFENDTAVQKAVRHFTSAEGADLGGGYRLGVWTRAS
jgi:hypothetical protein